MDDNAQPTMATSSMGGPAPVMDSPAQPQVQMAPPQQAPAPTPQPTPQDISVQHDSLFGRAAKAMMGNSTSYHVDQNGNTVPVETGNTFNQFARNVLSASILGAAAGANGNPAQGFAGGAVRGGAAAVGQQQQQDLIKRQQAEQQFRDQGEAQQQDRQKTLMQAQLQNMHSEMIARDRRSDIEDQELHDKHNAASAALEKTLTSVGGTPASIPTADGTKSSLTAPELAQAITKDPQILHAPDGFVRHFVDTTDSSELNFNGKQWVDASGQPVNMSDKTTVKAIDVPEDAMNKKVGVSGKDINAAYGSSLVDSGKTYQMSPSDMTALNAKRMTESRAQAAIDLQKQRANLDKQRVGLESRRLSLQEQKAAGAQAPAQSGAISDRLNNPAVQQIPVDPTEQPVNGVRQKYFGALQAADPQLASELQALHEGRFVMSDFSLARKDGQLLGSYLSHAFPDYDQSKAPAYKKMRDSFTTGVDSKQVEAANTTMKHAAEFFDNSQTLNASIPGTTAHNNLNAIRPQLVEEINSAYTKGVLDGPKRKELESGLASPIPWVRNDSVKQVMHLLADKVQEKQRTWQRGKPSNAIPDREIISPEGQSAFQKVTGTSISPTGEFGKGAQNNESQAARQPTALPQGNGGKIDTDTATKFLQEAGGDKDKARQLAQQHGWSF